MGAYLTNKMTTEEYLLDPSFSRSDLMHAFKSMYHFNYFAIQKRGEKKESESMKLGSLLHTLCLFGETEAQKNYAVMPECDRRTKAGKEIYADFCEKNAGKTIITSEQIASAKIMSKSIGEEMGAAFGSNTISPTNQKVHIENSIFWEEKSIKLKARPDVFYKNVVVELKTSSDLSDRAFTRSCYNYGYFIQAAMVRKGLRAVGLDVKHYCICAVENSEPFASRMFFVDESLINSAESAVDEKISMISECLKAGEWPSFNYFILSEAGAE